MKISICTRPLGNNSKTRGVGVYTRELIAALRKQYPRDQFVEKSTNPYSGTPDLVHYPFFDPFYLTLPWYYPQKTVITIHDLIPLKYKAHFTPGLRGSLKWIVQKYRAHRADAILTDSQSSARDIQALLHVPASKVYVVPLAASGTRIAALVNRKVKKLYHLPDRYILYVGDINWNKNVVGLVRAMSELQDQSVHLVLVGKVFSNRPDIPEYRELISAVHDSPKREMIHTLGYVPSHHLGSIYQQALLYCQPSWDEGFGLPILEAMRSGCPVVSSNRGSLPEVGGDAVIYFDPDKNNLVETLSALIKSEPRRQALIESGYIQSKLFSWESTAIQTKAVYDKVINL